MGETDLARLCAAIEPIMAEPVYVYCSFADGSLPVGLPALCTVTEWEGLTAIVERFDAQRFGVPYTFEARLITLSVHSSLKAVGLLAVVSGKLADRGIPCNVIAGYHHDHILVPVEQATEAMMALHEIGEPGSMSSRPIC